MGMVNNHQLEKLLTVKQILLFSTSGNIQRTVRRICILMLGCKGFISLTNRFHVAVRPFSNRSKMTSKCFKNKKESHETHSIVSLMFLPHITVFRDLLLNGLAAIWKLYFFI